jgi:hypothetical protein
VRAERSDLSIGVAYELHVLGDLLEWELLHTELVYEALGLQSKRLVIESRWVSKQLAVAGKL